MQFSHIVQEDIPGFYRIHLLALAVEALSLIDISNLADISVAVHEKFVPGFVVMAPIH